MGAQEQRGNLRPLESPEWMRSTAREVEYHLNISISLYIYNTYIYIDMCYYCHYWYHYYFCHYVIVSKIMCSSNMFFFKKIDRNRHSNS